MALVFTPRLTAIPTAADPTISTQMYAYGAETPFAGPIQDFSSAASPVAPNTPKSVSSAGLTPTIQGGEPESQLLGLLQQLEAPQQGANNPFASLLLGGLEGTIAPNTSQNVEADQQLIKALFLEENTFQIPQQPLAPVITTQSPLLNGVDARQLAAFKNVSLPANTKLQIQQFVSEALTKVSPTTEAAGTYARAKQINSNPFNQDVAWFSMQGLNVDATGDSLSKQAGNGGEMMSSSNSGQQDPREQRRQKPFSAVA